MKHVTRTINKIHFEDLSPERFENLILNLMAPLENWTTIHSIGQTGLDGGVYILAIETIDGKTKTWHIQCKRYKKFSKLHVENMMKPLEKNFTNRDTFLLAVSCDLSKNTLEYLNKKAHEIGYREVIVWDRSYLEMKLFQKFPKLLYKFFGIESSLNSEKERITRLISLKSRMMDQLLAPFDPKKPLIGPHRFNYSNIILKALNEDDGSFTKNEYGYINIYGWYSIKKTEPYNLHEHGFSLITDIKAIYFNETYWSLNAKEDLPYRINAMEISDLSYNNIIDIDYNTDDFNPLIYCYFKGPLGPFEDVTYRALENNTTLSRSFFSGARKYIY